MYIYHMTNSGLLISANGVKFLVDGIFSVNNLFNPLDAEMENLIMQSMGPFAGIDCLLFTHCHEGHYDGLKVNQYMESNRNTSLFLPEEALLRREVRDYYLNSGERIYLLGGRTDCYEFSVKDTKVRLIKTKHLDDVSVECDDHYSIVIDDGTNKICITGDMELNDEETEKIFSGEKFDAVFFNPVVFSRKDWISNFMKIDSGKKYIYHIPEECNDRLRYRQMTLYNYGMLKNKLGNCELLLKEMQKIMLKRCRKSA